MKTDFVDVDTIVHGKELTHRFKTKFKTIIYHPNGVIKSITNCYLKEGDDPEIDDFEFLSNMNENYKMVGNAVPVELARSVASSLREVLEDSKKFIYDVECEKGCY